MFTRSPAPYYSLTCIVDDAALEGGSNNMPDAADVMDADAFEALAQDGTLSTETNSIQHRPTVEDDQGVSDQESILIDMENSVAATSMVIDKFPTGSPGAPIPDMPRGFQAYESHQVRPGDSGWAPFQSQRDWEVARWAKMRGPTSSAVTELLAIPGVRASYYLLLHVIKSKAVGRRQARPFLSHDKKVK
jgi:hypothetical protein